MMIKAISSVNFRNKNININSEQSNNKHKIFKNTVLVGTGIAGAGMLDLFVTKGRVSSMFTKSKKSFIRVMSEEIDNVLKQDKYATKNRLEAFLSVPGLHAVWSHRLIHKLHNKKVPVLPRVIQNVTRFFTGIEIHPGAQLGRNIFIDHTGAIIGETARVGNNVNIIGRVVLGSTGKGNEYLRHTVVEDGATLGMNSVMLGRITIGKNAKVGAGSIVTHDVPPNSTVVGNPAKIISINGKRLDNPQYLGKETDK